MAELIAMGGHGFYVWGAYGASAIVIFGLVVARTRRLDAARRNVAPGNAGEGAAAGDREQVAGL